ncbi:DegT/DnrJ/EryC1/StrS family aminotransferase [Nocardia iowensis]|uniref:DegT/DnrJ/EryC1/StrS family aminotransferase n=1 Tax=Nocardia iowensis TaxID=204891 RepID=A0ABX8RG85_NOCIO|nr:DegT/DnrJ/EryC1/StrS family aminotransferase [Nocardia iowensis]QXN88376.1 DegT/DnrJ/EryC1/StrS family aminotransferase [Nocardia iowensis]
MASHAVDEGQQTAPRQYAVPYARIGSVLGADEHEAIAAVLDNGTTLTQGEWRARFEAALADYIGVRYAVTVTSGTVALALAIHLLDLRPGDEVIATPQTYQASIQPLLDYDVEVKFCDVDPITLNADPAAVERLIGPKTRAIVLVHYGGLTADMRRIRDLARRNDILVIEDAAHALGGDYFGKRPGSLADLGCFSFHSAKNITTLGEGGMITFDRDDWWQRLDRLRSNEVDAIFAPRQRGADRLATPPRSLAWMRDVGDAYTMDCHDIRRSGTNAAMSEVAAAVGLVQLRKLDRMVARRRAIAARLDEVLADAAGITVQRSDNPNIGHAYHFYTFFADKSVGRHRDEIIEALDRAGVEVQLRYFPLHLRPEWRMRGSRAGDCPNTEQQWFHTQVNLPCHPRLTDRQVDHLVNALSDVLITRPRAAVHL